MLRSKLFPAALLLSSFALIAFAADSDPDADAKAGAVLFRDKGCAYCHGASLEGTKKAPALAEIRQDKAWTTPKMTDQILNGGQKMPPFADSLSDDEVAKLIAYLRAKKRPVPPPLPEGETAPAPTN